MPKLVITSEKSAGVMNPLLDLSTLRKAAVRFVQRSSSLVLSRSLAICAFIAGDRVQQGNTRQTSSAFGAGGYKNGRARRPLHKSESGCTYRATSTVRVELE